MQSGLGFGLRVRCGDTIAKKVESKLDSEAKEEKVLDCFPACGGLFVLVSFQCAA